MAKQKLSAWNKFVKKHKGSGKTLKQLAKMYKGGSSASSKKKPTKATKKPTKATKKSSTGKKLSGWNLFVKKHKGSGKDLKQLAKMYKGGSSASSKKKPTKASGKAKRLTPANCEAVKGYTVSKGYRMTARKRKAGKRRTTKY